MNLINFQKFDFFTVGTRYRTRYIFVQYTCALKKVHEKHDTRFSVHESIHWFPQRKQTQPMISMMTSYHAGWRRGMGMYTRGTLQFVEHSIR